MSIQINRFEKREVKPSVKENTVIIHNNTTILIKDHKNDQIVSMVQLTNNISKNKEIADRIINVIEDYIVEQDNATENQN